MASRPSKQDLLLGKTFNYKSGVGLDKELVKSSDVVYTELKVQPHHKAKTNSLEFSEWFLQADTVYLLAFYKGGHVLVYTVHDMATKKIKANSSPFAEVFSPATPMFCLSHAFVYPYIILHMKDSSQSMLLFYSVERGEVMSQKVLQRADCSHLQQWTEQAGNDDTAQGSSPLLILSFEPQYPIDLESGSEADHSKSSFPDDSIYAIYPSGILEYPKTCFIACGLVFDDDQTKWDKLLNFKPVLNMSYLSGDEVVLASQRYLRVSNIKTGKTLIEAGPFPAAIRAVKFNQERVVAISYNLVYIWQINSSACEKIDLPSNPTSLHLTNTHAIVGDSKGALTWIHFKKMKTEVVNELNSPKSGASSTSGDSSVATFKILAVPTFEQEVVLNCKEQAFSIYLCEQEICSVTSKDKLSSFHIFGNNIICHSKQADGTWYMMSWSFDAISFLKKIPPYLTKNRSKTTSSIKFGRMTLTEIADPEPLVVPAGEENSGICATHSSGSEGDNPDNRKRSITVDGGRLKHSTSSPKTTKPGKAPKRPSAPITGKFPDPEADLYFVQKFKDLENWQKENVTDILLTQQEMIKQLQEEQRKQSEQITQLLALVAKLSEKK